MVEDLRYALRMIRKSPGFTSLAVLTLALGLGMNTAILSLVHEVFLRGLPFRDPGRIVRVYSEDKTRNIPPGPISVPKFWHYREAQTVFTELAADTFDTAGGYTLTGMGDAAYLNGSAVTANYFQLLGVTPIAGRLFLPKEEMKADVCLVSERFWRRRLAQDEKAVGRSITLNGVPTTIVGIIPNMPIAWFGREWDVWTAKPFRLPGVSQDSIMRGLSFLRVIGRLQPGIALEQAQAAMATVHASYRAQNAERRDSSWIPHLVPVPEDATGQMRPAFATILAATALLLFIASTNVANLLLVRFTGRSREISVRLALGASRSRIVRLFVVESTLLSLLAGLLGICMALWVLPLLPRIAGQNVPIEVAASVHWPVISLGILLSLVTGAVTAAYPASQSSRMEVSKELKSGVRAIAGTIGQQRFRRLLVAAQVCLALLLLAAAGLLITSYVRLTNEDAGFQPDGIWFGVTSLPATRYTDDASRVRLASNLQNQLHSLSGLNSVSLSEAMPLTGAWQKTPYARDGGVPMNERQIAFYHNISPGFLQTLGIPLISGRDFTDHDNSESTPVVLISQSTAKRLFPNENAVGQHIYFGPSQGVGTLAEIVGVVGDIRFLYLDKPDDAEVYRPFAQQPTTFIAIAARGRLPADAIASAVRMALHEIDSELPVIAPDTLAHTVNVSLGQHRLTTALLTIFAGVAMLLAVSGIYGAVAYTVVQRTAEIGVRMALGAQTADVLQLVVHQGMSPVCLGSIAGAAAAVALGRLLSGQLYGVSPHDPILIGTAAVGLALVAFGACLLPARRATRINPIIALRHE
jgi:predicted permease